MCNLVKWKFIVPLKTPSLPNFRVNFSYAFERIGVVIAGPLYVKDIYSRNENLSKCYLFLFTLLAQRQEPYIWKSNKMFQRTLVS